MNAIFEEIKPETAAMLASRAQALGISVDEFLNRLLRQEGYTPVSKMSAEDLDKILDELCSDMQGVKPLPADFSREDIYFDHD